MLLQGCRLMLALKPELVTSDYKTATPHAGANMDELLKIAEAKDWPGYFGDPSVATASLGMRGLRTMAGVRQRICFTDSQCQAWVRSSIEETCTRKAHRKRELDRRIEEIFLKSVNNLMLHLLNRRLRQFSYL